MSFVNIARDGGNNWVRADLIESVTTENGRATVHLTTGSKYTADPAVAAGDILLRAVGKIGTEQDDET